ncbi:MAG TPA: hypothetical protein VLX92_30460 [Kofleriaceae bacterium]|nr:hypothetical protein [Kofleriaceae bacterium]
MQRLAMLAALATAPAYADELRVDRVEIEVHPRRHADYRITSWVPSLDHVEISRDRFYHLVGRDDVARTMHRRRVGYAIAIVAGLAGMVGSGLAATHDRWALAGGLWFGGALTAAIGASGFTSVDDTTPAQAERMVATHQLAIGWRY